MGAVILRSLSVLIASSVFAQHLLLQRAPGAHVVQVSTPAHYTEPGIAVNPNNPSQVVVVYQGGAAAQGSANAAYSFDSGETFTVAQGTRDPNWRVQGDVTTTFDDKGHAFLCYMTFDHLGTSGYWAHNAGRNGIFVRRSLDGGKTWETEASTVKAWQTGHEPGLQFEDEPRIFADNLLSSPYHGYLYVGWVEWQIEKSAMFFSRSTDDGKTWSAPKQVSVHPGLPRDDNGSLGGYMQASDADGAIYAIWNDGNTIVMTESHDGGNIFAAPHVVGEVGPPYFGEVPGVSRVEGFPQVAVDITDGANRGRIYVCWSDYHNGDVDVFLSSAMRPGGPWSKPIRVNTDPVHDGADQFYQWMTVDPKTGAVYVIFYDRRDDPTDVKTRMTLARSVNGGGTFANYAWTTESFEGRSTFLGDYTWLAAYNNRVFGAWTENAPPARNAGPGAHNMTWIRVGRAQF